MLSRPVSVSLPYLSFAIAQHDHHVQAIAVPMHQLHFKHIPISAHRHLHSWIFVYIPLNLPRSHQSPCIHQIHTAQDRHTSPPLQNGFE
jgi:hypothetical protein